MNSFFFRLSILLVPFCFLSVADSKELIKEFKGSESRTTAEFKVKAPWVVDWRTTGDYPGTMAMDVHLITSPGSEYVGKIATTKWVHDGVKLLNVDGRFRLKVDSNLINWTLRVEQLTRQEAETYIPKEKIGGGG